jgi:hypothetical protein
MLLVPGGQEGLDVGEVLVQSGPTDAGALGDLGHRHREHTLLLNQLAHRVENGLPHLLPMRLHRQLANGDVNAAEAVPFDRLPHRGRIAIGSISPRCSVSNR